MKLTQILMRKRKMIHRPQSYIRNRLWNNIWYRKQEQPVKNIKILEGLHERNIRVYTVDQLMTPIFPAHKKESFDPPILLKEQPRDNTHPLWKEEPAYSYTDRSWQPKDEQFQFAQAVTNTVGVSSLPTEILNKYNQTQVSSNLENRFETIIKSCYVGDATQRLLPRDFRVPYIGWHPVESKMTPRRQYDFEAFSWGRNMPREYGIPNKRKLANLTRAIFKELCRNNMTSVSDCNFIEDSLIRQFTRRPDGKLLRFFLPIPFLVVGKQSLGELSCNIKQEDRCIPDVSPLNPVAALFKQHIYEPTNNFPILDTKFSHPYIRTVVCHNTMPIAPKFFVNEERAKSLMYTYATALGQARLLYGEDFNEDLPVPITMNSIVTNGQKYLIGSFQLNSMRLNSTKPNLFSYLDEELELFEFCGYEDAKVAFRGLNTETIRWLGAVMTEPQQSSATLEEQLSAS